MKPSCLHLSLALSATVALLASAAPSRAQTRREAVPQGWTVGQVRVVQHGAKRSPHRIWTAGRPAARPLTVTREFPGEAARDAETVYNRITVFNPVPSIDSGVQLPYGLDGIGGYGSDFGFSAASDATVYDRGP